MTTAQDQLALAASRLSQASGANAWDEFIQAFNAYSQAVAIECVQAPLPMLPVAQGRAQHAASLLKTLTDCRATSAKIIASQAATRRP